jgi:predicted lactoylglutathione lyase
MPTQIFVNLPVTNLSRSIAFYTHLGFAFNPQFTDEKTTCMIVSDTIFVMLLEKDRFSDFSSKIIVDAHTHVEVLNALMVDSRDRVDELMSLALAAGAREPVPVQDHAFMYGRQFEDLDGHTWDIGWMDPAALDTP